MKKIFLAALALSVLMPLFAFAQEPAVEPPAPNSYNVRKADLYEKLPITKKDIVFLGNSITDGNEWTEFFPGKRVKNRGISGDRTWYVLDRLDPILIGQPKKIFLMIGTNDLGADFSPQFVADNIGKIIERVQTECPRTVLYVQSIFPVNDFRGPRPNHVNKDAEIVEANRLIQALCAGRGIEYIDVWSALVDSNGKLDLRYTNDGLHLTGDGYVRWVEVLRPYVK